MVVPEAGGPEPECEKETDDQDTVPPQPTQDPASGCDAHGQTRIGKPENRGIRRSSQGRAVAAQTRRLVMPSGGQDTTMLDSARPESLPRGEKGVCPAFVLKNQSSLVSRILSCVAPRRRAWAKLGGQNDIPVAHPGLCL